MTMFSIHICVYPHSRPTLVRSHLLQWLSKEIPEQIANLRVLRKRESGSSRG